MHDIVSTLSVRISKEFVSLFYSELLRFRFWTMNGILSQLLIDSGIFLSRTIGCTHEFPLCDIAPLIFI